MGEMGLRGAVRGRRFKTTVPDHALADSVIGLFKAEVIRQRGPCRSLEDVEFAVLEWVWWFNHHRLLEPLCYLPPIEYEEAFYKRREGQALEAVLN